jgi:hypothetical protein
MTNAATAQILRRSVRAALLDGDTYEEVEADRSANLQAALVVVLSAASAGLGGIENHGARGVVWYTLAALVGWYLWAAIAAWIGTRWLPGPHTQTDQGELLRTLGFSSAPGVLRLLAPLPAVGVFVFLVSTVWMLVAMVVAVRHALDYDGNGRAVAVCAIGFPFYAITLALSLLLLGPWPI